MLNLVELPPWLILLPIILFISLFVMKKDEFKWRLSFLIGIVGCDQLGVALGGSMIDPVKVIVLLSFVYILISGRFPRISTYEFLFIGWLIARDLITFFVVESDIIFAVRYSLQLYIVWLGTFLVTRLLLNRYSSGELLVAAIQGMTLGLVISAVVASYQIVGFKYGLPINGVSNAYTDMTGGGTRWAAYSLGGVSFIRPWGLFGEPKFMGAFAVTAYAFFIFCYLVGVISKKRFLGLLVLIIALILVTASTSAFVSFLLVTAVGFVRSRTLPLFVLGLIVGSALLWFVNVYIVDLQQMYEIRVYERLGGASTTLMGLEKHELRYLSKWINDPLHFIFGHGYAGFAEDAVDGIRALPNAVLIYLGFSGGALLVLLYVAVLLKSFRHLKYMFLFVAAGSIYMPQTIFFVLFFLSCVAYKYLLHLNHYSPHHIYKTKVRW